MSTESPENPTLQEPAAAMQPQAAPAPAEPQVSSVADFRKKSASRNEVKTLELPSGAVVKLRRPSVQSLIRDGHIPADVAASLQPSGDPTTSQQLNPAQMKKYLELLDLIVLNTVVEPKLVPAGQGDETSVGVDELEDADKGFIMAYVQTGVDSLSSFRQ